MIDICTVVYRNYDMLDLNLRHIKRNLRGDYRILVGDNTPWVARKPHRWMPGPNVLYFDLETKASGSDGETHGGAMDQLITRATSDIIGTMDTDFFWLKPDVLEDVQKFFDDGGDAWGTAGYYRDWQAYVDPRWPDRAGSLAPVIWGQFVKAELARSQTFVTTSNEGNEFKETGWRLRQHLIQGGFKMEVIPGFQRPVQAYPDACYFGDMDSPIGLHILKGSNYLDWNYASIYGMVRWGVEKWGPLRIM